MSIRSRVLRLSLLLAVAACDRHYPLGTATDAGVPPASTGGTGTGGSGGAVGGGPGEIGGQGGGPGATGGQAGGNPIATGGSTGSGGVPAAGACPIPPAAIPERPLAIPTTEVASRLARFIWNSGPDPELLDRTATLKTNLEVKRLAGFMLQDSRWFAAVDELGRSWLGLHGASVAPGASEVRGQVDDQLRASMVLETETFLRETITLGDGWLGTLLLAPYSYLDPRLASLYGVSWTGPFSRVGLNREQRSGILTHASFLFLKPGPSARGTWLIDKFLCTEMPPPPTGAFDPPSPLPGETSRQTLERSVAGQACAPCHTMIDPTGFAFEHYDALGRWRDQEAGQPIDATGMQRTPAQLKFDGARQLGEQLLGSCEVRRCMAQTFLQRALGESKEIDEASLAELTAAFEASGLSLRWLFADVAASRPFLAP